MLLSGSPIVAYHEYEQDEIVHKREALHRLPRGAALQYIVDSCPVALNKKQRLVARRVAKFFKRNHRLFGGVWWWLPRRVSSEPFFGLNRTTTADRLVRAA